jgi:hypothetical protein
VKHVLFRWADSLETPRADEMGRRGQRWRTGSRGPISDLAEKHTSHYLISICYILTGINPDIFLVRPYYGPLAAFRARFSITITTTCVLVMSTVLKAFSEGLYLVIRNGFGYILLSG